MLLGCDISSHQRGNYKRIIDNNNAFALIKATEGKTYKNSYMDQMAAYAEQKGKLIGFYHYARPENGNTAETEARNFCDAVKEYIGRAVLVLDYEGSAHKCGAKWAADFIKTVKRLTGVLPLFYTSESYLQKYKTVAETGAGLWVAKYSSKSPKISPWTLMAMWQYRSFPYDKNRFYGDRKAWMAYAKKRK